MHKLILSFDVEDFINSNTIYAISTILDLLNRYKLRAIFFITGHMAEKLINFPNILDQLKKHEIGFHSSSHSVRPIISEFTDLKKYEEAYYISLERETSHINPLTGNIEGKGGILFLQELFHPKKIEAYRAPGMSWNPPHLKALIELGIKYDFSSKVTDSEPVWFKGTTFYPYTFIQMWKGSLSDYKCLLSAILKRQIAIFDVHPTLFVNKNMWDSIYYGSNPKGLYKVRKRSPNEALVLFRKFEFTDLEFSSNIDDEQSYSNF